MDYETWDTHTTELHNKHGHTCKPKPKERFTETSIYEFVNDWLPTHLAWQIFSYCAAPHAPKKVIADHYAGIGQRYWELRENKPLWLPRIEPYRIAKAGHRIGHPSTGILTPENRIWGVKEHKNNKLVVFLFEVRLDRAGDKYIRNKKGNMVRKCSVLISLQDNKVKGRTLLMKKFNTPIYMSDQEKRARRHAIAHGYNPNNVTPQFDALQLAKAQHRLTVVKALMSI
jgi:hypothetical protein